MWSAEDDNRQARPKPLPAMMVVERRRNLGRHLGRLAQRRLLEFGRQILLHEIDRRLGMRQHSGQPRGPAAGEPRETAFHLAERLAARARQSVVWGKSVSVRVEPGGRRINKKKTTK